MPSVMSDSYVTAQPVPMDPSRRVAEQDCSKALDFYRGNLLCK